MTSWDAALELLEAAVIDGRTENVRYRQDQLQSLHGKLREEAAVICAALSAGSQASAAEAETEYYLGMDAVRHFYETLDFEKELESEYLAANGKDNPSRRVGAGIVVIRPTTHTRFYSIVCPLAAAISAGNAVILELQDTISRLDSALRTILVKALDVNVFHISKVVADKSLLEAAVLVDQTGATAPSSCRILSSSGGRAIAVVDRTADIEAAAKSITTARFSFGGSSPYAPDLVLVNEFVKQEFFEACSRYATLAFARENVIKRVRLNESEEIKKLVREAETKRQVSSFGSEDFKLIDISDKSTTIARTKITGRYLPIATFSSLVDAIFNHELGTSLLATYIFAERRAAKYMSQNLPSQVACINQIPVQLLVGPAAPTDRAPDFLYRYSKDMFSVPQPQYVEPLPAVFQRTEEVLLGTSKHATSPTLRQLAVKPLRPTGQPKNEHVGFFESGLLLGGGVSSLLALSIIAWTSYVVGRKGLEFALRLRSP